MINEAFIKKVLKSLSKRRVVAILEPGGIWVIDHAIKHSDKVQEALNTCLLRGWVEIITEKSIPAGDLNNDGGLSPNIFNRKSHLYRITDSGWNRINNNHGWLVKTFFVALLTLIITLFGILISFPLIRDIMDNLLFK